MRLRLDVFGDVQFDRRLLRFQDHAADMTVPLTALAADFHDLETRQFASEGGSGSGGWAPLAPATVRDRIRHGFPGDHPILHRTGALEASLTDPHAAGAVERVAPDSLFVGTNVSYARFHQTGTRRMPRRRPVEFTERDRRRWVKVLQRYIVEGT